MEESLFFRSLLDDLFCGVYFVDLDRNITFWNKGAERISGFPREEVLGRGCRNNILNHVDENGTRLCLSGCPLAGVAADGQPREIDVFMHHKNGHRVPVTVKATSLQDEQGHPVGVVEIFSDNSPLMEARQKLKALEQEALLDHLTQLHNRRGMERLIAASLAEMERTGESAGLLFIDIDHFKKVNDTFGHDVGDLVLKMVAETLARTGRPYDTAGRWGGEEFVALIRSVDEGQLKMIAERYRILVRESFLMQEGQPLQVTISLGGTIIRKGDTLDTLVKRADEAAYASKQAGRNCVTLTR